MELDAWVVTRVCHPRQNPAGNIKVPANQRAKSALSTAAPGKLEMRSQRPCGAVPCAGAVLGLEDIQTLSHPVCHSECRLLCAEFDLQRI